MENLLERTLTEYMLGAVQRDRDPTSNTPFGRLVAEAVSRGRATPASLAHAVGVAPHEVEAWVRGSALPRVALIRPLAQALDVPVERLLASLEHQRLVGR